MHRAHYVGGIGLDRLVVRESHYGLRGEVQNDLRLEAFHCSTDGAGISDVREGRLHAVAHAGEREEVRVRFRREGVPRDARAALLQPQAKPASLEAGMA